jgi:O-antigen ligase/tetratricopeptide (TPR) repeat protein
VTPGPQRDIVTDFLVWNDRLIEAAWLLAVFAIPLLFSPPGCFSYFELPKVLLARIAAGLIAGLWTFDLALTIWYGGAATITSPLARTRAWLAAQPLRWAVVAAVGYWAWALLSTISSPIPQIGFWGFEYGRDGLSFVSISSMLLVFLAVALRLHRRGQVVRLVAAVVVSGFLASVYALLQDLAIDPYDLSRVFPGRVVGTMLNPIFLASMLLQTIPLVLVVGLVLWGTRWGGNRWPDARWPGRFKLAGPALAGASAGFTLLIIILTSARGPWVGTAVSLIFLIGLILLVRDKRAALRGAAVLALALVVLGVGLVITPTPDGEGAIGATIDRVGTYAGDVGGDVSGRTSIWSVSGDLITNRPWFEHEDGAPSLVRHLFGYGPDSFLFVYPLQADLNTGNTIKIVKDAHNLWVHTAVEIGVLGALFLLAVSAVAVLVGAHHVVFRWRDWPTQYRLLAAALVAIAAGRGVEQLVGVAQISDAMLSWSLLALLVALPRVVESPAPESLGAGPSPIALRTITVSIAASMIAIVAMFTISHNWDNALSARDAALSSTATREDADILRGIETIGSAVERAPASTAYRLRAAGLFNSYRLTTATGVDDITLIEGALNVIQDGLEHHRVSLLMNVQEGESLMDLVRRGRADLVDEAADAFKRAASLYPRARSPQRTAATRLLELDLYAEALIYADRTIALSVDQDDIADALLLKAVAQRDLGHAPEAITTLNEALARAPDARSIPTVHAILESLQAP